VWEKSLTDNVGSSADNFTAMFANYVLVRLNYAPKKFCHVIPCDY